jgi:hypothetical protein
MLALGIPGEELTAMMLAVFLVHNVIPGPDLFANRPEFVAGLYWTLLLMNVVIILFLLVATNAIAKAALINKRFLGVAILTLSLIGTYASGYRFLGCRHRHGLCRAGLCAAGASLALDADPAGRRDGPHRRRPHAPGPGRRQRRPDDLCHPADLGDHGGGAGDADRLHLPRLDQAPQCTRGLADQ